jgi:hypothetical protein
MIIGANDNRSRGARPETAAHGLLCVMIIEEPVEVSGTNACSCCPEEKRPCFQGLLKVAGAGFEPAGL